MLSAADSEPLNDYFQGEFWPADERALQKEASSTKRKPGDAWGLPWGNSTVAVGKRSKEGADAPVTAAGIEPNGGGDRQQQLLNERRARNRRHARETRRRKKESLHDMLAELEALRALKARHEGGIRAARDAQACRRLTRNLELVLALRAQAATGGRSGSGNSGSITFAGRAGSSYGSSPASWEARWRVAVAPEAVLVAPMAPYRFSALPRGRLASSGHCHAAASRDTRGGAAVFNMEPGRDGSSKNSHAASKMTFASTPLDDLGSIDSLAKSPRGTQHPHHFQQFASGAAAHSNSGFWGPLGGGGGNARGPAAPPPSSSTTQVSAVSATGVGAFMAEAAGLAVCVANLTERGLHEDDATQAHWEALAQPTSRSAAEGALGGGGSGGVDDSSSNGAELNRGPPPPKPPKPSGASLQQSATSQANSSSSSTTPPLPPTSSSSTPINGDKDRQQPCGATRTEAVPSSPSSVTHCLNPTSASSSEDEPDDLSLVESSTPPNGTSTAAMRVVAPGSLPVLATSTTEQPPLPPSSALQEQQQEQRTHHGVHLEHVLLGDACLGRNGNSVAVPFELRSKNLVQDFGCHREVCERGTIFAEFAPPATVAATAERSASTTSSSMGMDLESCEDGLAHCHHGGSAGSGNDDDDEEEEATVPLQLVRLELSYDVVAFWRQLQAAKGGGPLAVQPRTLAEARRCLSQAANPAAPATTAKVAAGAAANGSNDGKSADSTTTKTAADAAALGVKAATGASVASQATATALSPFPQALARAVVSASPPHMIEECNDAWRAIVSESVVDSTGKSSSSDASNESESVGDKGQNLHCLLGLPSMEASPSQSEAQAAAERFASDLAAGRPSSLGLALLPVRDEAPALTEAEDAVVAGATFAVVEATPIVGEGIGTVAHFLLSWRTTAATA